MGDTLCVKPYPKWDGANLCGVLPKGTGHVVDSVVRVDFAEGQWQADATPVVMPKAVSRPATRKVHDPYGNVVDTSSVRRGCCGR